ncbi:asparagine synthase (glutamine-hydrolyzing) [Cohnella mopanensis]|uniref:asparagine synthase (glutamine-hydrolyzing) n=1 Tax=Cohnella mopanensis TaxID=2911966 RepID=UPI001EF76B48|nr:asparagine synthase (glutamine-hydrolyzing) [Cohnella mopanensis]
MCGIFGYYSRDGSSLQRNVLQSMADSIKHRGPDDCAIWEGKGVALGNQRLSIIDIEGGNQPFISDDGNIIVVQNGEIYNHIELAKYVSDKGYPCKTNSDTEVILRLYEVHGIDFVDKLNGMFSIAIYDSREDAMYVIRDRVGVKPLYVSDDNGRILFGSEIKTILKSGIRREVNDAALSHYLSYNFVPPPFTMFKNITHLMPGHWMKVSKSDVITKQWWNLSSITCEERSESYWIDQFLSVLDDAVRIRLRADVPFGAFLSGGVDSSTVVGLMSKHMNRPVKTFSIGFHDERFDESPYAQQVADLFHTDHTMEKVDLNMLNLWSKMIYHCDQPHGDVSFMPTYKVSQLASKHVKMVLTGDGGDELFAGYDKYKHFFGQQAELDDHQFESKYFDNISLFTEEQKNLLLTENYKRTNLNGVSSFDVLAPLFQQSAHMDRINKALYIDTMLLLPGNNLVKPDRMGMAVSLEARTPFLDVRMVEMAFKIPGKYKLMNGETKYIFKKAVESLLGNELVYRKKQMFTVPIGEWFKKDLAAFTEAKLLEGNLVRRGIVNQGFVRAMLTNHQSGKENNTRLIRALISLEYWFDIFINESDLSY